MAVVRCVRPNPADPTSGLKLLSSGMIQAYGDAIPPADWEIPEGWTDHSARDMHVIDHLTPSGYVLSHTGTIWEFGGVTPAVGFQNTGAFHIWRAITMNPAGNGQGYEWDVRGRAYRFGPTLPPYLSALSGVTVSGALAGGIDWGQDIFTDVHLDWSTKRYAVLSNRGHLVSPSFTITWDPDDTRPLQDGRSLYRAMAFVNPAIPVGDTAGYVTTYTGRIYGFNDAEHIRPFAVYPDRDVVIDLNVLSDGRAGRALILEVATDFGSRNDLTVSVEPEIVVIAPSASTTTTTRPSIIWEFTDADGDAMARADVKLFSSAQYGAGGFDPATSDALSEWTVTDPGTFRVDIDFDLPNASYRAYVKATDTAGDSSGWEYKAFTVTVTKPPVPTLVADTDSGTWTTTVTVTAGVGTGADFSAILEYSDDPDATNSDPGDEGWIEIGTVAYPTSGAKVVVFEDVQAPFNLYRTYRARTVNAELSVSSEWEDSNLVEALLVSEQWVLTPADSNDGMAVSIIPEWSDTRDSGAVAHYPVGRSTAVVTRTIVGSKTRQLAVRTLNRDGHDLLDGMLTAGTTLLLRSPYRHAEFVSVVGEIERSMLDGVAPEPDEVTEMRFAHVTTFSVVEVARP
jgi:hypothetical protein